MNTDQLKGKWHQMKGEAKIQWGKDRRRSGSGRERREARGPHPGAHGYAREKAAKEVELFQRRQREARCDPPARARSGRTRQGGRMIAPKQILVATDLARFDSGAALRPRVRGCSMEGARPARHRRHRRRRQHAADIRAGGVESAVGDAGRRARRTAWLRRQ